jgi:hypothetical protein
MFVLVFCVAFAGGVCFSQELGDFRFEAVRVDGREGWKISGYAGNAKSIVLPSVFRGGPVLEIGAQAFFFKGLSDVLIPEGIVVIGRQAFFGNKLRDVFLPKSVATIDRYAFDANLSISVYRGYDEHTGLDKLPLIRPFRGATPTTVHTIPPRESASRVEDAILLKDAAQFAPAVSAEDRVVSEAVRMRLEMEAAARRQAAAPAPFALPSERDSAGLGLAGPSAELAGPLAGLAGPLGLAAAGTARPSGSSAAAAGSAAAGSAAPTGSATPTARGVEGATGSYYLENLGSGAASISSYRPFYRDAVIPATVGAFTIKRVGAGAFAWQKLNSVIIAWGVEHIGDAAFSGNQFTGITIPESVRYIGNQAFSGNQLKTISIGSGVVVKDDSFLNRFSEFYNLNGKQGGTYILEGLSWEYFGEDGQRSILRDYIQPEELRAMQNQDW